MPAGPMGVKAQRVVKVVVRFLHETSAVCVGKPWGQISSASVFRKANALVVLRIHMATKIDENDLPIYDTEIDLENEKLIQEQSKEILKSLRTNWNLENLNFETFTNGITNRIYAVYLDKDSNANREKLIFRVFGRNTEKIVSRAKELDNFIRLSKMGLAAPIYAKFKNGIICGYLEGTCLDVKSVRVPKIIDAVCKAMAHMHKIKVEGNSEPAIFSKTRNFLDNIPSEYQTQEMQQRYNDFFTKNGIDLEKDFLELSNLLKSLNNRVVFCHNDLLVYNILYDENSEQVHFIDYEYADVNYQLFDIANHFNEYAGVDNPDFSLCPETEEKRHFIEKYLSYFMEHEPSAQEVELMVDQVPYFEAASHFFWAV